jgi:hypothetical protein
MAFLTSKKGDTNLLPISGGNLVDKLYGIWGKRWLVDRLLLLTGKVENDWIEFKATFCPPKNFRECYPEKCGGEMKYTQGDYYLHVVKSVVSLINLHGGAILLGVAQNKGMFPEPADEDRLCESISHKPVPFSNQYFEWDTDSWHQYLHNIFQKNEWIDRYGRIWNCSEVLDDKYIKLYNGILHKQPIIIITVFPAGRTPVELKLNVHIGKRSNSSKKGKGQSEIEHCIRRVKCGGSCHWPHSDPEAIETSVVPFRVRGDTASVDMKWRFSEITKLWESREQLQIRFSKMLEEEDLYYKGLPFGLTPALESILNLSLLRVDSVTSDAIDKLTPSKYYLKKENNISQLFKTHLDFTHHTNSYTWLTVKDSNIRIEIYNNIINYSIFSYTWGNIIPIYARLEEYFDHSFKYLFEAKKDFFKSYFLPRLAKSSVTDEHWRYLGESFGFHLIIDNIEVLEEDIAKGFLNSIRYFKEQYPLCFVTIISGPYRQYYSNYFNCHKLTIKKEGH